MWGTRKHGQGWASGLRVLGQPGVMIAIFNREPSPGGRVHLFLDRLRSWLVQEGDEEGALPKWWLDSGRRWAGILRRDLRCELFWSTWSWKAVYSNAVAPPKTQSTRLVADTHLDAAADAFVEAYVEETVRPDWVVTSLPYNHAFAILKQAMRVGRMGVAFKIGFFGAHQNQRAVAKGKCT